MHPKNDKRGIVEGAPKRNRGGGVHRPKRLVLAKSGGVEDEKLISKSASKLVKVTNASKTTR